MISLTAVGDIMLGDHPVCFGHGIRSSIRKKGFDFIVRDVEHLLKGGDVCFGNLETVLSTVSVECENVIELSELRADSICAEHLAGAGFNMLNLANNHILQHGFQAFYETVENLKKSNLLFIGAIENNKSNVQIIEKEGVQVVFVGYSLRPEKFLPGQNHYARYSEDAVLADIARVKASLPRARIVVSLHWGDEYLNYPSAQQIDFAHRVIDHGVDCILGHHPHVLQGVEEYNSGVIFYSLGNFIFDKWQRSARETVIAKIDIGSDGVEDYHLIPVLIRKDYSLSVPSKTLNSKIAADITSYSKSIVERDSNILGAEEYGSVRDKAYLKFRMQSYLYFVCNIWRYNPSVVLKSFLRFIARRLA